MANVENQGPRVVAVNTRPGASVEGAGGGSRVAQRAPTSKSRRLRRGSDARRAYIGAALMLVCAFAFPVGLMIFNPTLMFERGWEQYVGTAIYFVALTALAGALASLWRNESAFAEAEPWLAEGAAGGVEGDVRVLSVRIRQLSSQAGSAAAGAAGRGATIEQLMELNREASGLDQEQAAGRFTLPRYILYLLPVIGFIGTVEGISKALMNISRVLPMVKELDGFLSNLTSVTSALQIAFDSTLLALFLSAALMFVQTLIQRCSEDLLARVDRWVVERWLPARATFASHGERDAAALAEALAPTLERLRGEILNALAPALQSLETEAARMGAGIGPHVVRFAEAVERLPKSALGFERGAEAVARAGTALEAIASTGEALREATNSLGSLARIEHSLGALVEHQERLESEAAARLRVQSARDERLGAIEHNTDRAVSAIESLSTNWTHTYEKSSRATQEQLARTLGSLKDALDLLNVSIEQGNALYRSIVKKLVPSGSTFGTVSDDQAA